MQAGLEARNGQIIEASIVTVPIQRNSREKNRRIKAGDVPEDWDDNKARQKDTDARWTKQHGKRYFGDKNLSDVDAAHKLIRDVETTAANVHDSQVFDDALDPDNVDPQVCADSAYRSEATEAALSGPAARATSASRARATNRSPRSNRRPTASAPRPARVEHIFGFQQNSLGGTLIRTTGQARAEIKIGCMSLTDNLMRYPQLTNPKATAPPLA